MSEADYSTIGGGDFPPDAKTLIFRGVNGYECENFVRSVRFIALTEGKDEDDRWMLRFATARFAGRALRWHARLDKEIRKDWDRLVLAMLDEYAADSKDEARTTRNIDRVESPLRSTITFSNSLPPEDRLLAPGLYGGLIRVVPTFGPSPCIYLSRDLALKFTMNKAEALHVQFLQSAQPHEIEILQLDCYRYDKSARPYNWRLSGYRLAIQQVQIGQQGSIFKVCPNYPSGSGFQANCWRIGSDNVLEVTASDPASGTTTQPETLIVSQYHQCLLLENYELWAEENPNRIHYKARLVFEPIVEPFASTTIGPS